MRIVCGIVGSETAGLKAVSTAIGARQMIILYNIHSNTFSFKWQTEKKERKKERRVPLLRYRML